MNREAYRGRLLKGQWEVRPIDLLIAQQLVEKYHYAHGGANTATYTHGLFEKGEFWEQNCKGCCWWLPPTKAAALATYPDNWEGVLSLSRLVIVPDVPKNACTFLLARSMKMIDRDRWPALVTYADEWQNHNGTIYKAANWEDRGLTAPEPTFIRNGRLIARKAGPKTRTRSEMENLGAKMIGRFSKRKFVHII